MALDQEAASRKLCRRGCPRGADDLSSGLDRRLTAATAATSVMDFSIAPASATITIPAESTSAAATAAFTVTPVNDGDSEGNETIEFGAAPPPAGSP